MTDSWTKSATVKILRGFFGPLVRLDEIANGEFVASLQCGASRFFLASGPTPYDVFHEAILLPVKMKEARDALEAEENAQEAASLPAGEVEGEGGATPIALPPSESS